MKNIFTLVFIMFASFSFGQVYTVDGDYCSNVAEGDPAPDEYEMAASVVIDPNPSSSCEISTIYADVGEEATLGEDNLVIAYTRGNQGTATFLFFINTDCDNTTGDTSIGAGGDPRNGAEVRIQIEAGNNGAIEVEDVGTWNGTGYDVAAVPFVAATGVSDGCAGTNSNFVEFAIPLDELVDQCIPNECGSIELTVIETQSGGSINSSDCQQAPVVIELDTNEPPSVAFTTSPDLVCLNEVITLDASATTDPDFVDGDALDWQWTSDNSGTFDTDFGIGALAGSDISTTYTPTAPGTHTLTLTVTDEKDCEVIAMMEIFATEPPVPACTGNTFFVSDGVTGFNYDGTTSTEQLTSANGFADNLEYLWDFGDGGTSTMASGTYEYSNDGTYTVTLTVTDPDAPANCNTFTSDCVVILPVKLTSFKAEVLSSGVAKLEWVTASEINNEKFVIERRVDGSTWVTAGEVAGNGDSQEPITYTFIDNFGSGGLIFYRLKQVDFDGMSDYSDVIQLGNVAEENRIYVTGDVNQELTLNIELTSEDTLRDVQIVSLDGKTVQQVEFNERLQIGTTQRTITLPTLGGGLYLVVANFETQSQTTKFMTR